MNTLPPLLLSLAAMCASAPLAADWIETLQTDVRNSILWSAVERRWQLLSPHRLFALDNVITRLAGNVVWGIGNYTDHIAGGAVDGVATVYFDDAVVSRRKVSRASDAPVSPERCDTSRETCRR